MSLQRILSRFAMFASAHLCVVGFAAGAVPANKKKVVSTSFRSENSRSDSKSGVPEKLIIAYASSCALTEEDIRNPTKVRENLNYQVAKNGVNVLIWAFIDHLGFDSNNEPQVFFSQEKQIFCIGAIMKQLKADNLKTLHLVSIGGWNAPHPDNRADGKTWFEVFDKWNKELGKKFQPNAHVGVGGDQKFFAGIDWDLEGNDKLDSIYNHFNVTTLDIMGEFSVLAKKENYFTSLVPPQSYFDVTTHEFDRSLRHSPRDPWNQNFTYVGLNSYMYVFAKYGKTEISTGKVSSAAKESSTKKYHTNQSINTFDIVQVQLYESWSHAAYQMEEKVQAFEDYLVDFVRNTADFAQSGRKVNFGSDAALNFHDAPVELNIPSQLVIGFSFGSSNGKSLFVWPKSVQAGYRKLSQLGLPLPRGFMYWNAQLDGHHVNGTNVSCNFAAGLNEFVHTRESNAVPDTSTSHGNDGNDRNSVDHTNTVIYA